MATKKTPTTKATAMKKAPAKKASTKKAPKAAAAKKVLTKKATKAAEATKAAAAKKAPAKKVLTKKAPKAATVTKAAATTTKKASPKKAMAPMSPERAARVYGYSFASIYAMYVQKVERKGRTKAELDEVIGWLTGYRGATLQRVLDDKVDLQGFFAGATMNPNANLITGVICGVRIEDLEDPLMKKIRWLDKVVDELALGRTMERILRSAHQPG